MTNKNLTIVAYEMYNGRNFVGIPYQTDIIKGVCRLKKGCKILTADLSKDKDYKEQIIELYQNAEKTNIIRFSLDKAIKKHEINFNFAK